MSCHQPHSANVTPLLKLPQQPLCAECHEIGEAAFTQTHAGVASEQMDCVSCHNPHASKDPKYFKDVMHAPFAARSCQPCHLSGE
jgi:predicted CXXCH cytochrome family protein